MRLPAYKRHSLALFALIVVALLVIAGLTLYFVQNHTPGNDTVESLSAELPIKEASAPSDDLAKVPLYPNAVPVELPPNERVPGALDFHVTANSGDIQTFYDNALPKNGWSLYYTWAPNVLEYIWQDPKLALPYLIHLTIFLDQGDVLLPPTVTDVNLHIWREPDPNDVPLMNGAQSIQSKDDVLTSQTDVGLSRKDNVRTVTYLVDGKPDDVLAYYETMLPTYGWTVDNPDQPSSPTFREGITYHYYSSDYNGDGGPVQAPL